MQGRQQGSAAGEERRPQEQEEGAAVHASGRELQEPPRPRRRRPCPLPRPPSAPPSLSTRSSSPLCQMDRMEKSIEAVRRSFASVRTGRANPAMLDRIEASAAPAAAWCSAAEQSGGGCCVQAACCLLRPCKAQAVLRCARPLAAAAGGQAGPGWQAPPRGSPPARQRSWTNAQPTLIVLVNSL